MRKNKRYTQEEMYLAIEMWQESGLSQSVFCKQENLKLPTFGYWLKKYKAKKKPVTVQGPEHTFIPVELPGAKLVESSLSSSDRIEVSFPNGVKVSCPAGIDISQLKTLINL